VSDFQDIHNIHESDSDDNDKEIDNLYGIMRELLFSLYYSSILIYKY